MSLGLKETKSVYDVPDVYYPDLWVVFARESKEGFNASTYGPIAAPFRCGTRHYAIIDTAIPA